MLETGLATVRGIFEGLITPETAVTLLSLAGLLVFIFLFFRILNRLVLRFARKVCKPQVQMFIEKGINYTAVIIILLTIFNRLGINVSALMGAAGIVGIAVGFAAQTSVSNVISGLFVMSERAFEIGDLLEVNSIVGTVVSIDLLSIRLKTAENQFVRIPNETIIKTNLINKTHYPFRRFTLHVGVAYGTDLRKLKEILLDIAAANQYAVSDPEPVVIFNAFTDSSIEILFGVWAPSEQFLDLKNSLMIDVSERFVREGIEIPFPQRVVTLKEPV